MVKKTKLSDFEPDIDRKTTERDFEPDLENCVAYPIIPAGLTGLLAQPGSYKSWLLCQLVVDVALGRKYLGVYDTNKRKLIYVDEDTPPIIFINRLERCCAYYKVSLDKLGIEKKNATKFDITKSSDRNEIIEKVLEFRANGHEVLTVIDCLGSVCDANLDRTDNAKRVMSYFREIRDCGTDLIVAHHLSLKHEVNIFDNRISSYALGSTSIMANMDHTIFSQKIQIEGKSLSYLRHIGKRSNPLDKVVCVELIEDLPYRGTANLRQTIDMPRKPTDNEIDVFKLFPLDKELELTIFEMQKRLGGGFNQEKIEEVLDILISENIIVKKRYPGKMPSRTFAISTTLDKVDSFYKSELIK